MKSTKVVLALLAAGAVGVGGYWLGGRTHAAGHAAAVAAAVAESFGGALAAPARKQRKLLYYRNPMGLPDTSPTPRKDPMGMDYIPVYEGEDGAQGDASPNQVRISTEKIQKLGVRTEAVTMRQLGKTVRAAGRVEPDERRVYAISPKFEGYVERMHVNVTGQPVAKGQPLFEVYSPELVSAQREYAIAAQGVEALKSAGGEAQAGMKQLAESSLARLRNWDLSPEQVAALGAQMLDSPVSGTSITVDKGKASLMVGGEPDAFERARPVLEAIGPRVIHVGPSGSAVTMKIAVNLSLAVQMLAFSEGVLLAEKTGIAREKAVEVMLASVIASPMVAYRGPLVLGHPDEVWFDCHMMQKDMNLALELGRRLEVPLPTTAVTNELLTAANGMGIGDRDFAVLFDVLAAMSGVSTEILAGVPA